MPTLKLSGVALAVALVGFAFGRFSAPAKTVTVESEINKAMQLELSASVRRVQNLESQVESLKRDTHKTEVIVTRKDGTSERTITTDTHVDRERQTQASKGEVTQQESTRAAQTESQTTKSKTVENAKPNWGLGASAGIDLQGHPTYGGEISRRVIGPFWLGLSVDTAPKASLTLRMEF